jgi:hypothetical protein
MIDGGRWSSMGNHVEVSFLMPPFLTASVITVVSSISRVSLSRQCVADSRAYRLEHLLLLTGLSSQGRNKMPLSTDRDLQARLLNETSDLYARKQQLEDKIRKLDVLNDSLQDTAAIRDIEAHKSQRSATLR